MGKTMWQPSEGNVEAGRPGRPCGGCHKGSKARGGRSREQLLTLWPAVGLPIPGPWSLRTVDPNHVLQDEDSLCQDLQGLSQLLHPLTLEGRKQPGSGPFCIRVHAVPVPPIPASSWSPSSLQQPSFTTCQGWRLNSCSQTRNLKHREGNQGPLDTQPGSG